MGADRNRDVGYRNRGAIQREDEEEQSYPGHHNGLPQAREISKNTRADLKHFHWDSEKVKEQYTEIWARGRCTSLIKLKPR